MEDCVKRTLQPGRAYDRTSSARTVVTAQLPDRAFADVAMLRSMSPPVQRAIDIEKLGVVDAGLALAAIQLARVLDIARSGEMKRRSA